MKIGIITFHRAINYGAILQTYALQKALCKLGAEAEVIDYRCGYMEEMYLPFNIKRINGMKQVLGNFVYYYINKKKRNKFRKFMKYNIATSKTVETIEELKSLNKVYNKFITGSDQVWNAKCSNFDKAYFLEFCSKKEKRYSYAASFGVSEISPELEKPYKQLLSGFNSISVREVQGAQLIKKLIDEEVQVHLDPTFLLNKDEWKEIITTKTYNKDYILLYLMDHSDSIIEFCHSLAERTQCEIIYINSSLIKKVKGEYARTSGPEEFLGLFEGAKYVVTNSFHGTAFSINFNKDVFIELLPPPAKVNSRLENIMDQLGLRNRQIIEGKNNNLDISIDYERVNKILEDERKKSIEYLRSIVEDSNE